MTRIIILVKMLRECQDLSIRDLENLSGVSKAEISRIENGEVSPTLDTLFKLSVALGVNIHATFVVIHTGENQSE